MSPQLGELFAGIGGFGLAAQRAGFELAWACEIDDFASRVYGARFPGVSVHPDVRDFEGVPVDCITAGFPCQDLSVAGKRKGLIGERSGLFWEIIRIASRLRPRWLLLENVPGLLSSHKGRDFETVLAALDELGYGVAWRVLDAQFFGVPQRRRRVFIVGHLGGPCPAEVLFEPEGVSGNLAARREARTGTAGDVAACLNSGGNDGGFRTEPGEHLVAHQCHGTNVGPMGALRKGNGNETGGVPFVIEDVGRKMSGDGRVGAGVRTDGVCYTHQAGTRHAIARPLTATSYKGPDEDTDTIVTHSLRAEGADASEDGTGRGTPIVPVLASGANGAGIGREGDPMFTLDQTGAAAIAPVYALGSHAGAADGDVTNRSHASGGPVGSNISEGLAYSLRGGRTQSIVETRPRRLTPRECERLQGFPDDWTLIEGASDSARYRALGNAVAVPCVEWILRRLAAVA